MVLSIMKLPRILQIAGLMVVLLVPRVGSAADYNRRTAIVEAVAKTRDAIVNLRTLRSVPAKFNDSQEGRVRGLGTGVIIDPRGYIVTNHHVVEDVSQISVLTSDNLEYTAHLVNSDPAADLAVLRVDASNRTFSYLPLWGVEEPILGEMVIAIGNPYGLENSVTTGIVSAVNRRLKLPNDEVFEDLIQTDASINPGNSGGPLLTVNGELLGINVAIRSYAQGIGFAIPTPTVRRVVRKMMAEAPGTITKQGLYVRDRKLAGEQPTSIISVDRVEPGSRAEQLGFRPGDEIVAVEDQSVLNQFDLERMLWGRQRGELVTFRVRRGGSETTEIKLTMLPSKLTDEEQIVVDKVGLEVKVVEASRVRNVFDKLNGGLLILSVASGSPADLAGLRVGDILVGLHDWETIKVGNICYVMRQAELLNNSIDCHYIRNGVLEQSKILLPYFKP